MKSCIRALLHFIFLFSNFVAIACLAFVALVLLAHEFVAGYEIPYSLSQAGTLLVTFALSCVVGALAVTIRDLAFLNVDKQTQKQPAETNPRAVSQSVVNQPRTNQSSWLSPPLSESMGLANLPVSELSLLEKVKHGNVGVAVGRLARYHHQCNDFGLILTTYRTEYLGRPMNTARYGKAAQALQLIKSGHIKNYSHLVILDLTVDAAPLSEPYTTVHGNHHSEVVGLLRRHGIAEQYITGDMSNAA